jgi:hypothetical protein
VAGGGAGEKVLKIIVSTGKQRIKKVVDFVPLRAQNYMNLGFGDLLPDNTIDYNANSNNGDIIKVLATIIDILKHFTARHPEVNVFFAGSTDERTKLYARILRTYHAIFSKEFSISGVIGTEEDNKTILFDPQSDLENLAFIIKRIN